MRSRFQLISLATVTLLLSLYSPHLPITLTLLPATAQTTQDRKAEGDRLFQQGLEQYQISQFEATIQSFQQALQIYREIKDRQREGQCLNNLGVVYRSLARHDKAIEYFQQSLTIAREIKDREGEGQVLANLGSVYKALVNYDKAIEYYQQSLAIAREIKDKRVEGQALGNLGNAYYVLGSYDKAIEYYQQSLAIAREIKDRQGEATVLGNLGLAYKVLGHYDKAIEYYQQSLAIAREIKDRQGEGEALANLGSVYKALANYSKAIEYHQQSLAIAREIKNREGEGTVLNHLGHAYYALGNYDKAIDYFQQSLAIAQEIKSRWWEGQALRGQGMVDYALANYDKAIEYYQQSLAIVREIKDRRGEGAVLIDLGNVYNFLGNYGKAIEYFQQGLIITREIKDRQGEATTLGNLGLAYLFLGNYDKAIGFHQQRLAIAREIKDRQGEGQALGNLGVTYYALGNYPKAIEYHQQSLAIVREIRYPWGEGTVLGNLGIAYHALGNYDKAIGFHQQRLAIAREIKDRQGEGQALGNMGIAYHALGNYDKAIGFHQQRLAIVREIKDHLGEGESLNNLGYSLFKSDNLVAAEKVLFDSLALWESIRQTGVGNNDANKISIFERQASTYRTLQKVLVSQNKSNTALEVAERGRARAFVELLAKRVRDSSPGKSVTGAAEETIKPPTVAQLQQIAKAQNATLVQYSILYDEFKIENKQKDRESELYIWVIQPTGEISFRKADLKPLWQQQNTSLPELVISSRERIGAVDRSRASGQIALSPQELQQRREQQTRQLRQLHQLLIEPIADLLPQDPEQRVIFVPQGALFLVPFPTLPDKAGKFLIEQHTLLTAPSIQVLELTHQQKKGIQSQKPGGALVVGNPIMPKVRTEAGGEFEQLRNLPGAEREAEEIADLLNTKAIIGNQATKSAILKQLSQARMIHFATHGLLDDFKGLGVPGAIAFAPSGNGQLNDGLLTADELLDMKLNAELVVLSACDTGRGRITGDGVIGLSRSLITAGVPSIVVSLWKVPDEPTALLMTEFYKNLQKSSDKAQALRQAMLTTKTRYPDPLNWAAFTLIGEAK